MADKLKVSNNDIEKGAKILFIIIALFLVYKFGKKFIDMFTGNKEQEKHVEELESAKNNEKSPWAGKVYIDTYAKAGTPLKTAAFLHKMTKDIHNSFGFFHLTNGFDLVLEQMKQLKNKSQVAQLVEYFRQDYNQDLASWLQEQTHYFGATLLNVVSGEESGLKNILDFVKQLPK